MDGLLKFCFQICFETKSHMSVVDTFSVTTNNLVDCLSNNEISAYKS